jgi:hypothetical protein
VLVAKNSEDTLIELRYERKDSTPGGPWQDTWLPGGIGRPGARDAASRLLEAFVPHLRDTWRKGLEEKLKLIPVAEARWLQQPSRDDPILSIITSLPFKGHEYLKSSRFRVFCKGRSSPVCLVSRARSAPGRYKEEGTNSVLETLVVEPRERQADCNDPQMKTPVDKVRGQVIALIPPFLLLFDELEDSVMEGFSK